MKAPARPLRVLVVAYKIERGKGSEDGAGYNIVRRLLERGHHVTLITRRNNTALLEADPAFQGAELVGVDVPRVLAFYKKQDRGIILYYYVWQIFVAARARQLCRDKKFDVVHQLNFHTDWAPHFLPKPPGARLVWGPMSHHKFVPPSFFARPRGPAVAKEVVRASVKRSFWMMDPFLRRAISRTDTVLYADDDVARPFRRLAKDLRYRPYAASFCEFSEDTGNGSDVFTVLSVGRLVPLKGFLATVDGFAAFAREVDVSRIRLVLVGSGELARAITDRLNELGIAGLVSLEPWMDQRDLASQYQRAHVFVYPSFEAQGLVVAEALAAGLPVMCLAQSGPAFIAGPTACLLRRGDRREVASQIAENLHQLYAEFQIGGADRSRSAAARRRYFERLDWPVIVDDIEAAYVS